MLKREVYRLNKLLLNKTACFDRAGFQETFWWGTENYRRPDVGQLKPSLNMLPSSLTLMLSLYLSITLQVDY